MLNPILNLNLEKFLSMDRRKVFNVLKQPEEKDPNLADA